ncbi:uncharacterized protein [Physcomitrium patens]|uniref:uncharacterized protein n=1 Tax=Physcomitrium patens TaxID=3218 RepID=UPI003CCE4AFE
MHSIVAHCSTYHCVALRGPILSRRGSSVCPLGIRELRPSSHNHSFHLVLQSEHCYAFRSRRRKKHCNWREGERRVSLVGYRHRRESRGDRGFVSCEMSRRGVVIAIVASPQRKRKGTDSLVCC